MQRSTHHLKQKPYRRWLDANTHPEDAILYVGIDASEQQRTHAITRAWQPWRVEFPMREPPYLTKDQMLDWARTEELRPPHMYAEGFFHNNFYWITVAERRALAMTLLLSASIVSVS